MYVYTSYHKISYHLLSFFSKFLMTNGVGPPAVNSSFVNVPIDLTPQ